MAKSKKPKGLPKPPKIQVTTDYNQFNLDEANRPINEKKVQAFIKAMKENPHAFAHLPAWIGKDNSVLEGQHRLKGAEAIAAPFYFTKSEDTIEMAGHINKNNTPWRSTEWIHHYSIRGVSNYEKVVKYGKWYMENLEGVSPNPPWRALAALLSHATTAPGGQFTLEIQTGELGDSGEKFLKNTLEELKEMQDIATVEFLRNSTVLAAYTAVKKAGSYRKHLDDFEYEVFKEQLKRAPEMMTRQRDKNDYKRLFEDIYNYKKQIRVRFT